MGSEMRTKGSQWAMRECSAHTPISLLSVCWSAASFQNDM